MTTRAASDGTSVQLTPGEVKSGADVSQWFHKEIKISTQARRLLEQYAGLKPEEVIPHIADLRQRAFEEWPYPCIGHVRFLELTMTTHPKYSEILTRLQAGQSFLDVGCCFGQDIRKLLYDGVPSSKNMYGIDIEPAFFQLGYELFRDRNTLEATFLEADLIKSQHPLPGLEPILGKFDIISAQSLFHLFNLDDQKTVARHLISLTKPGNGAVIAGRQVGCRHAREGSGLTAETRVFAHNVESWTQLWEEVGRQTGSQWEVQATEEEPPERLKTQKWYTPDISILVFTLFRRQ